jgi:hypothetical protein
MENTNSITIADLSQIKIIIEVACERGAFRAPELKTVGTIYERLSSFLDTAMIDTATQSPDGVDTNTQGESQ